MAPKQRLDILLYERHLAPSREKARTMIMAGEVLVDGITADKPGLRISPEAHLAVKNKPRFVSRGGEKLLAALERFSLDVKDRICADIGASTGGFTDCLLQKGASRVYAIDVGYGQLDYTLRQDSRVVIMERTNARYVESLPTPISLAVIDASFISLKLLLPVISGWLEERSDVIALIKPQFEAGRKDVGKGGVVKSSTIHANVLGEILSFSLLQGFIVNDLIVSPLKGPAGNVEFLAWLSWKTNVTSKIIEELIKNVVPEI